MTVVAIGNFDGLHLGHQAILKKAIQIAESIGQISIAYTFVPHPRKAPRLMSDKQKQAALKALGVNQVIFEPFTPEFAALSGTDFIEHILLKSLQASHVVVGPNFSFGAKARDSTDTLLQDTRFKTHQVEPLCLMGQICSSTLIRQAITTGDLELAKQLLGRPYSLSGKVVEGAKRGTKMGFPTANLQVEQEVLPPVGVYATHTQVFGKAATNIGRRPTFSSEDQIYVETHFLNFQGSLYGEELEICLDYKIRDEQKFESIEALKAQIGIDVQAVSKL